jgi:predicted TIM-barrel fold metal-dependent hydrolase
MSDADDQATHLPMFDADNHIYEPIEALTQHLPAKHAGTIELVQIGKRTRIALRGQITDYIPNPTFEVIAAPGAHIDFYSGNNPDGLTLREMGGDPIRLLDSMRWPDARLALMDEQGLERTIIYPTLANLVEFNVADDPDLTHDVLHALNEWLHEVWTFDRGGRAYAAAAITCALVDRAIAELEWALGRGAKVILMRPSPVIGYHGSRSFSGTEFDPFWARVEEAGVGVCLHGTQPITSKYAEWWAPRGEANAFTYGAYDHMLLAHRDIQDTIAGLICQGTLTRFPGLRIASVENGAEWVHGFFERLGEARRKYPKQFPEDPIDVFHRNVYVSPFWEEDLGDLVELCGSDRVLFGSDWPHPEGLAEPRRFLDRVAALDPATVQRIVNDNTAQLVGV